MLAIEAVMSLTGDPVLTTTTGIISLMTQIIRLVNLKTDGPHDPKFVRMMEEFTGLNDRISIVQAQIIQLNTMFAVRDEYRGYLQAMSGIKNKVYAVTQNPNNATRDEFLRVCEQHDPSNVLTWIEERTYGAHGNVLGDFLLDIVKGVGYNRTEFDFWQQSIKALNTQAIMYRLMYIEISGKFDNVTIASQTERMKTQAQIIHLALQFMETRLQATFPSEQLPIDIKMQLSLYKADGSSTESAAIYLQNFLVRKYKWVHWMVVLHDQSCSSERDRSVTVNKTLDISGLTSGVLFFPSVVGWSVLVAWKSSAQLSATPEHERERARLKFDVNWYAKDDRWNPTIERGITSAGNFLETFLKPHLRDAGLPWNGIMVVKKECNLAFEPRLWDERFFNYFMEGFECTFSRMPFLCGWIVRGGEAHIVIFPAAETNN